jgi:serine protease
MYDRISKSTRTIASRNQWKQPGRWVPLLCLLISMLLAGMAQAKDLLPRRAAQKEDANYSLPQGTVVERVVLKFHEGTRVRWRDKVLIALDRDERQETEIARLGLTEAQIDADVAQAQLLVAVEPQALGIVPLLTTKEETLDQYKARGEQLSGEQLADLNLYFEVQLQPGTTYGKVEELLAELNRLLSVEIAYAEPPAEPAAVAQSFLPATELVTPSFQNQQGYLNAAPQGIDALYAWGISGGKGQGVKIIDLEWAWRTTHEDMPPFFYTGGTQSASINDRNHGTAVMGEMVAKDNGIGVTGIANQAQAGYESFASQSTPSAITNASVAAGSGNVLLLEIHRQGPANGSPCDQNCNPGQCDYIAIEYWQADYDAIAAATANGRIVVEAAGNGSSNLDDPAYMNLFNRGVRDSKAILVAASLSTNLSPTCWTNWGSRIDAHGWGENVVTMGYGNLYNGGTEDQWYTNTFSGTSSASPIVTGAAASLQGAARAASLADRSPLAMRQLIASTGTPQNPNAKNIGPRPNLRAAMIQLRSTCTANATTLCLQGNRFKAQVTWKNGGVSNPGFAMPYSNEGGYFHFGGANNPEVGVKVFDGRPLNGKYWVFHSALTSLEYTLTVTDLVTGVVRTYNKAAGSACGGADGGAFNGLAASTGSPEKLAVPLDVEPLPVTQTVTKAVTEASCTPTATSVCAHSGRFRIEVKRGGVAQPAVTFTDISGVFWFFSSTNPEVAVKVIDGTPVNGRYWVFFGPLTDQAYQVVVTDTNTGTVKTYNSPPPYCGIADTNAF